MLALRRSRTGTGGMKPAVRLAHRAIMRSCSAKRPCDRTGQEKPPPTSIHASLRALEASCYSLLTSESLFLPRSPWMWRVTLGRHHDGPVLCHIHDMRAGADRPSIGRPRARPASAICSMIPSRRYSPAEGHEVLTLSKQNSNIPPRRPKREQCKAGAARSAGRAFLPIDTLLLKYVVTLTLPAWRCAHGKRRAVLPGGQACSLRCRVAAYGVSPSKKAGIRDVNPCTTIGRENAAGDHAPHGEHRCLNRIALPQRGVSAPARRQEGAHRPWVRPARCRSMPGVRSCP